MANEHGMANLMVQVSAYGKLEADYDADVAASLTTRNFQRHGVDTTNDEVRVWNKLNVATIRRQLDIPAEVAHAEGLAGIAAGRSIARSAMGDMAPEMDDDDGDDDDDDDFDDAPEEDPRPDLDELYGYEDPEDNEEAALDDVLKIEENS